MSIFSSRHPIETDAEYEDWTLTSVERGKGGWTISQDSLCFWCPDRSIEPKVGDTARLYGKGFGYRTRGLSINGQVVFYRTRVQDERQQDDEVAKRKEEKRREFEVAQADLDTRVAALPETFRERIERFRRNNEDFRWQHEGYELFCCEEAVKLAQHFASPDAIEEWARLPYKEQQAQFPNMSNDHSGNTFGAAHTLAVLFLRSPEQVPEMHGALCPLVGCTKYGCVPSWLAERSPKTGEANTQ